MYKTLQNCHEGNVIQLTYKAISIVYIYIRKYVDFIFVVHLRNILLAKTLYFQKKYMEYY